MIEINIHPNLVSADFVQSWVISWHGFYSFVAVATAVLLVGRWAPLRGVDPDAIYTIAIWGIVGGYLGARLAFMTDNWDVYRDRPEEILYIWRGGMAIWGGLLGGFVGGVASAMVTKQPVGRIADMAAPALLFVFAIGRIGDIVNGEHCARATDFFFGFTWTHPATTAAAVGPEGCQYGWGGRDAVHPAVVYDMLWNIAALALVWRLWGRLRPDGMLFATFLALYSVGRFWTMFLREQNEYALDLVHAQVISVVVLIVVVPLLIAKARFTQPVLATAGTAARGTRAQRRRRR